MDNLQLLTLMESTLLNFVSAAKLASVASKGTLATKSVRDKTN
jgi:hypothetical protein